MAPHCCIFKWQQITMRYYQNISNVWCGCNRIEMDIAWYTKSPIWYTYVYILCVNNNPVHMQIDTWLFMNMGHMLVVTLPSKHQHFFFADICLAAAKAATLCQGSNTDESRHSPKSTAESSASAFIKTTAIENPDYPLVNYQKWPLIGSFPI